MPKKIKLEKAFLSERDLEDLGLRSRKTSQNLRSAGLDPLPFVRLGRSIRYPLDSVLSHLERHRVMPGCSTEPEDQS
jgi:hypothetical protein